MYGMIQLKNVLLLFCSRVANYVAQVLLRPGASDLTGSFRSDMISLCLLMYAEWTEALSRCCKWYNGLPHLAQVNPTHTRGPRGHSISHRQSLCLYHLIQSCHIWCQGWATPPAHPVNAIVFVESTCIVPQASDSAWRSEFRCRWSTALEQFTDYSTSQCYADIELDAFI